MNLLLCRRKVQHFPALYVEEVQLLRPIVLIILLFIVHITLRYSNEPLPKAWHLKFELVSILIFLYHDLITVVEDSNESRILCIEKRRCNDEIVSNEANITLSVILDGENHAFLLILQLQRLNDFVRLVSIYCLISIESTDNFVVLYLDIIKDNSLWDNLYYLITFQVDHSKEVALGWKENIVRDIN